jgi:very-short-patch-repair endonuclease
MPDQSVSKQLRSNAKRLRSQMTDAEKKLWREIRAHRLEGISFRRQIPIEGGIVAFAAPAHRLIVELDGSQHPELQSQTPGTARDRKLPALDWTTLHFWNAEGTHNPDGVCRKTLNACGKENF